jgi:hypothetical protein
MSPTCTTLILLLISHSFFFGKTPGDGPFHTRADAGARVSLIPISFQDGPDALPLWFDCRLVVEAGLGTGVRQRIPPHGVSRWGFALLFQVMKGRNGRGDDHGRLDRLEVRLVRMTSLTLWRGWHADSAHQAHRSGACRAADRPDDSFDHSGSTHEVRRSTFGSRNRLSGKVLPQGGCYQYHPGAATSPSMSVDGAGSVGVRKRQVLVADDGCRGLSRCPRCLTGPGTVGGCVRRSDSQVAIAAGRDDTLPMLTGIRVRFPVSRWSWLLPTDSGWRFGS